MKRTAAEIVRDEAIDRVRRSLTRKELEEQMVIVAEIAETLSDFTTDDVPFVLPAEVDRRAIGAIMRSAATELKVIRPTPKYRKSNEETCHARPKQVWESLIYL